MLQQNEKTRIDEALLLRGEANRGILPDEVRMEIVEALKGT